MQQTLRKEVMTEYLEHYLKPAGSAIAVKQNPLDAMVEIECIAVINNHLQRRWFGSSAP